MTTQQDIMLAFANFMVSGNPGDHSHSLGISLVSHSEGKVTMMLDYHNAIVASPETGAIAGGAVTTLLDSCSGCCAVTVQDPIGLTPTIDLRIDYLRTPVINKPIFAEVKILNVTPHVIFTQGIAWQEEGVPIATSTGNFMNKPAPWLEKEIGKYINVMDNNLPKRISLAEEVITIDSEHCANVFKQAREQNNANLLIDFIPYAKLLGMQRIETQEADKWWYQLTPSHSLIGNPTLPAIHGGALAGFMEISALLHLTMKMDVVHFPKTVDFSIDYIRAGLLKNTYARCKINRFGNKLISMTIEAWQDEQTKPIAKARMQVLIK